MGKRGQVGTAHALFVVVGRSQTMRTTQLLLATVVASLSASVAVARVALGDAHGDTALAGDTSRVAQPMADGGIGVPSPQPSTPIYPGPAPGLPGTPPGSNPATPPSTPPGANPGNNPGVNPGANPGNPGNAPGMNPGAGHGTPGTP
jgi:hypothetical protein